MHCQEIFEEHCFTEDGVTVAHQFQTLTYAISKGGLGGKEKSVVHQRLADR